MQRSSTEITHEDSSWRRFKRVLLIVGVVAGCIALFVATENWRGKWMWRQYKDYLEARGEQLDWEKFIPPSVPDEDNVLRAPFFRAGNGTAPLRIRESGRLYADWEHGRPTELVEWRQYFDAKTNVNEIVLATGRPAVKQTNSIAAGEILPLIVIEDAPLLSAITTLARQANIDLLLDEKLTNAVSPEPTVSFRFEKITAWQAFHAVLDNYNLSLSRAPVPSTNGTPAYRIIRKPTTVQVTGSQGTNAAGEPVYESIRFEFAQLIEVIRNMAELSGIEFQFDESAQKDFEQVVKSYGVYRTTINTAYRQQTAREVLEIVLRDHSLTLSTNGTVYKISFHTKTATEILRDFEDYKGEIEQLYAACERPAASFDINYKDPKPSWPNMMPIRTAAQSLALRASAELALGKSDAALRDIKTCLRLADVFTNSPILIGAMMRGGLVSTAIGPAWEGLAAQRWNETQLADLQSTFSKFDLITSTVISLQGTRAFDNYMMTTLSSAELCARLDYSTFQPEDWGRKLQRLAIPCVPRGWIYQNLTLINRCFQECYLDGMDAKHSVIHPEKMNARRATIDQEFASLRPDNFIAVLEMPSYFRAIEATAKNQTSVNQTVLACALERYRLAHKVFPEKLELLTHEYLQKVPNDVINGQPLRYKRTNDHYILYSIGWDEVDNGGSPSVSNSGETGDWVWQFPVRP